MTEDGPHINPKIAATAAEFRKGARQFLAKRAALGAIFEDAPGAHQVHNFGGMIAFALATGIIDDDEGAELLTEFVTAQPKKETR